MVTDHASGYDNNIIYLDKAVFQAYEEVKEQISDPNWSLVNTIKDGISKVQDAHSRGKKEVDSRSASPSIALSYMGKGWP